MVAAVSAPDELERLTRRLNLGIFPSDAHDDHTEYSRAATDLGKIATALRADVTRLTASLASGNRESGRLIREWRARAEGAEQDRDERLAVAVEMEARALDAEGEVARLTASLAAAEAEAGRWQPIEMFSGRDGEVVLTAHHDDLFPICAFRINGEWLRMTEGPEDEHGPGKWEPLFRAPTHWMPAPFLPALSAPAS